MGSASPGPTPGVGELSPLALLRPTPFGAVMGPAPMPDGTTGLVLRYELVTGSVVLCMPGDEALRHGQEIVRNARAIRSGLYVPTADDVSALRRTVK